jgi:hypothetical protein
MVSIPANTTSATLADAFRAAFLLTGSVDAAENAVMNGVAALDSSDDLESALVANTVELVMLQGARLEHAFSMLPCELSRLLLLAPLSRDCYLLGVLFGLTPAKCAALLNLRIDDFEELLCEAVEQLSAPDTLYCPPGRYQKGDLQ